MNRSILGSMFFLMSLVLTAQQNRYAQPELPGEIMIDLGVNQLMQTPDIMEAKTIKSRSFAVYYMHIFKLNNYFTFNPAVGIAHEKINFERPVNYQAGDDETIVFDTLFNRGAITKNKLAVNYIELPIEFRFFPLKTVKGEGLFLGVGGIIGTRIESHTKVKYKVDENTKRSEKLRDNFGLANFRLGVQARMGLRGFHAFGKYYFTNLYGEGEGPEASTPSMFTVGITLSGF